MFTSLTLSFLAGLFSFFAPCGVVLLPSFFAYTFKKRSDLFLATGWFLAGFLTLFIPLGLGVHSVATLLLLYRPHLAWVGGLFFFFLAFLALSGKGLHIPTPHFLKISKKKNDAISIYFLGVVFGFTIAGCTAPLLALALSLASLSKNTAMAVILLITYGIGLASPLFFLALVTDRSTILQSRWFRGKVWTFTHRGKEKMLHSTNLISAVTLVIFGILFITSQGTFFMANLESKRWLVDFNVKAADILAQFLR